jgi:hypothetical protein
MMQAIITWVVIPRAAKSALVSFKFRIILTTLSKQ